MKDMRKRKKREVSIKKHKKKGIIHIFIRDIRGKRRNKRIRGYVS